MNIKSQKDFLSGLMFLVVGGVFAWGATHYSIGTGARMGPGYFPLLLGVILVLVVLLLPSGIVPSFVRWRQRRAQAAAVRNKASSTRRRRRHHGEGT